MNATPVAQKAGRGLSSIKGIEEFVASSDGFLFEFALVVVVLSAVVVDELDCDAEELGVFEESLGLFSDNLFFFRVIFYLFTIDWILLAEFENFFFLLVFNFFIFFLFDQFLLFQQFFDHFLKF